MAFVRLEDKKEIAEAQKRLDEICRRDLTKVSRHHIGYPAGMIRDQDVRSDGARYVWQQKPDTSWDNPKFLNFFGYTPEDHYNLHITLEVNVLPSGHNRSLSGMFARDTTSGEIYLMHDGGIRGGTTGQNKGNFLAWLNEDMTIVHDSIGRSEPANIVMPLSGPAPLEVAFRYVDKVARFKAELRAGNIDLRKLSVKASRLKAYYSEGSGRRTGRRSSRFDYVSRHGMIVDALKNWREEFEMNGLEFKKDVFIDLGLADKKDVLRELYEVKTSADRQSIYGALGQLFVHGRHKDTERYIVLPDDGPLAGDLMVALRRLAVRLITFKPSGRGFVFEEHDG